MKEETLRLRIAEALQMVKDTKPLVEQITNYVTVNDCANVTLAIGASPVMGDGYEEAAQMTAISGALVLNFGMISAQGLATMLEAGKEANRRNIPIVFDPVGMGATAFRAEAVDRLLREVKVQVIKGNASEIMALAGEQASTKGVDATAHSEQAEAAAIYIAKKYRCTCGVTGEVDLITDGQYLVKIHNASDLLAYITGTGCMIASLIGSFLGATGYPFISTVAGILAMSVAGESALLSYRAENEPGIASYREMVMNEIFKLTPQSLAARAELTLKVLPCPWDVYLVTDEKACGGKDFLASVEAALQGGAKMVQLREKQLETRAFVERAQALKTLCAKYKVPFLINDRLDVALAVDADGVHLGQSDMPIETAKKLLGPHKIVGISAKTMAEGLAAQEAGADYIGVGAIFATGTKEDVTVVSKEQVRELTARLHIPVLGIGGITADNAGSLGDLHLDGVCVVSDILGNEDPKARTEALRKNVATWDKP